MSNCPTCGKTLYIKKGYNKKSLKNLLSYGHRRKNDNNKPLIRKTNKCIMPNCKNKKISTSNLCLEHYINRGNKYD